MDRWIEYNPNPIGKRANDCAIRALCKALDPYIDVQRDKMWDIVYSIVHMAGYEKADMPSTNDVWDDVLEWFKFRRYKMRYDMTVEEFCEEHPSGIYVLCLDGHVVTAVDGFFYDSWDSSGKSVIYFWERER